MTLPDPAPETAVAGLSRRQLLRNASAVALGAAVGVTALERAVSPAAAANGKTAKPSKRPKGRGKRPTNLVTVTGVDSNRLPWQILEVPQINAKIPFKALFGPDPDTGMQIFLIRYDAGFTNTWHTHPCAHGMWVIDGILETRGATGTAQYGPGNLVWFPEGGWMEHGAAAPNDCTFLFITNKEFGIFYESDPVQPYPRNELVTVTAKDSNRLPWEILEVPQINAKIPFKALFGPDPDTGAQIFLIRYDAGFTNTWHTHPCAHGMWVIDGVLETHGATGTAQYGPGNLVWFPEGGWMEHGAAKPSDCTFLFITNKEFGIFYESDPNLPYPPRGK